MISTVQHRDSLREGTVPVSAGSCEQCSVSSTRGEKLEQVMSRQLLKCREQIRRLQCKTGSAAPEAGCTS